MLPFKIEKDWMEQIISEVAANYLNCGIVYNSDTEDQRTFLIQPLFNKTGPTIEQIEGFIDALYRQANQKGRESECSIKSTKVPVHRTPESSAPEDFSYWIEITCY